MTLAKQKALAERFRAVSGDKAAVAKLADESCADNPDCADCHALCERFRHAADGASVIVIADEVKARKA